MSAEAAAAHERLASRPPGVELEKWLQTIRIAAANSTVYKLNFFLRAIGPALVFFLVQYNVWSSIYALEGLSVMRGYTLAEMLEYQAWVLILGLIVQGHNSMQLSEDIRLGRISAYLLYPFEFWKFHTASFAAFQLIQLTVCALTLVPLFVSGLIGGIGVSEALLGGLLALSVSILWFLIQYSVGLLSFWLEETWVLRVMVLTAARFLSGSLFPLELYPPWLAELLLFTPFPYLTYVPVSVLMGSFEGSVAVAFAAVWFWIAVLFLFSQLIWRRGMRLYTAAGI